MTRLETTLLPQRGPTGWYHYVYGNVPGHQLDWILTPSGLPPGLSGVHVQHLQELILERDAPAPLGCALTLGNLSTRDSRYSPGHGALAIILHSRIPGCVDHMGRANPRFIHAAITSTGVCSPEILAENAGLLWAALTMPGRDGRRAVDTWFRRYQGAADMAEAQRALAAYLDALPALRSPEAEGGPRRWRLRPGTPPPPRVDVLCGADATMRDVIPPMAVLASELGWADFRWTSVSTEPGKRVIETQETEFCFLAAEAPRGVPHAEHRLDALPEDGAGMLAALVPLEGCGHPPGPSAVIPPLAPVVPPPTPAPAPSSARVSPILIAERGAQSRLPPREPEPEIEFEASRGKRRWPPALLVGLLLLVTGGTALLRPWEGRPAETTPAGAGAGATSQAAPTLSKTLPIAAEQPVPVEAPVVPTRAEPASVTATRPATPPPPVVTPATAMKKVEKSAPALPPKAAEIAAASPTGIAGIQAGQASSLPEPARVPPTCVLRAPQDKSDNFHLSSQVQGVFSATVVPGQLLDHLPCGRYEVSPPDGTNKVSCELTEGKPMRALCNGTGCLCERDSP